ncbi:hypothetical protein Q0O39_13835, partial [Staphylococcus aureus]|nr:hypothetical protein [Staphylococcus aureus]
EQEQDITILAYISKVLCLSGDLVSKTHTSNHTVTTHGYGCGCGTVIQANLKLSHTNSRHLFTTSSVNQSYSIQQTHCADALL